MSKRPPEKINLFSATTKSHSDNNTLVEKINIKTIKNLHKVTNNKTTLLAYLAQLMKKNPSWEFKDLHKHCKNNGESISSATGHKIVSIMRACNKYKQAETAQKSGYPYCKTLKDCEKILGQNAEEIKTKMALVFSRDNFDIRALAEQGFHPFGINSYQQKHGKLKEFYDEFLKGKNPHPQLDTEGSHPLHPINKHIKAENNLLPSKQNQNQTAVTSSNLTKSEAGVPFYPTAVIEKAVDALKQQRKNERSNKKAKVISLTDLASSRGSKKNLHAKIMERMKRMEAADNNTIAQNSVAPLDKKSTTEDDMKQVLIAPSLHEENNSSFGNPLAFFQSKRTQPNKDTILQQPSVQPNR